MLEAKREGLRPRQFLRWNRAQRWPFGAIRKCPLASSAGNGVMPRQKSHAFLASLKVNQVMHPFVFDGQNTAVAKLAGRGVMPFSECPSL